MRFIQNIQNMPWAAEAFAVAAGLMLSWLLTQFLKRRLAVSGWPARGLAAALGFAATLSLSATFGAGWIIAFWLAAGVALGSPTAYKTLVSWKGDQWAWVRHLSGDPWDDEHEDPR